MLAGPGRSEGHRTFVQNNNAATVESYLLKLKNNLPPDLLKSLRHEEGFDEKGFVETHNSGEQVTSIRLNPAKHSSFSIQHPTLQKVPWSTEGKYLDERPSFTLDPLFHAGVYYVQEASSMFLEQALKQTLDLTQPLRILDLCAAPGGKSNLIQSLISPDSLLVCNEIIKARVNILAENLTKWGAGNVVVTNNHPKDFKRLKEFFDVMVVDAPCSGSGLFRKDADAIDHWSPDSVDMCARRQKDILADALTALKPNGVLIYSTCSYSFAENEEVADWLVEVGYASLSLKTENDWGIVETFSINARAKGYRFYPDKIKGEGFFIAAFKKRSGDRDKIQLVKKKLQLASPKELLIASEFIREKDLHFVKWEEHILAMPASVFTSLPLLQSTLYVKKAGVNLGSVIREELIPHHELAMSIWLADVPAINVDEENALDFLRRRDIKIDSSLRGWLLIKFNNVALGWIKNMGNRINNYYPREWRILNK